MLKTVPRVERYVLGGSSFTSTIIPSAVLSFSTGKSRVEKVSEVSWTCDSDDFILLLISQVI